MSWAIYSDNHEGFLEAFELRSESPKGLKSVTYFNLDENSAYLFETKDEAINFASIISALGFNSFLGEDIELIGEYRIISLDDLPF